MKYYFITYLGIRRDSDPSKNYWHAVTDDNPMQFRQKLINSEESAENNGRKSYYMDFIIINTCEISEMQYDLWKDQF